MNRIEILMHTLPRWLEQIYGSYQLIIVDYSSHQEIYGDIRKICSRYQCEIDYNNPKSDKKVNVIRINRMSNFNMSHAINIGIRNSSSEIISIAGCETSPAPFYLESVMMTVDHNIFTRCQFGRLSFPRNAIEEINGYPELFEYWGAEDDIVSKCLVVKGMFLHDLDPILADNISHHDFSSIIGDQYNKFSRNYNRGRIETKTGSIINLQRYYSYRRRHGIINNYGKAYGADKPILADPSEQDDTPIESTVVPSRKSYIGARLAVVIPCMNRLDNLSVTLPMWFEQVYHNKQIVIIDYNSDIPIYKTIESICDLHKKRLSYNKFDYDADCVLFRINGTKYFNISHAYNYCISKISCDIISTTCADSCPRDYYLDCCANLIDDHHYTQCYWGLHTITYENWKKINGHQEIIVGYGVEDEDFSTRASLMGLYQIILPEHLIFNIPNNPDTQGENYELKNIKNSEIVNRARLYEYIGKFGYTANYGLPIGNDHPIDFVPFDPISEKNLIKLSVCSTDSLDKSNPPDGISYSEIYDVFYTFTKDWFDWTLICEVKKSQIFVLPNKDENIDKYLFILSQKIARTQQELIP